SASAAARAYARRAAHAGSVDGLSDGADARRAGKPRDRRGSPDLRPPRSDRRRDAQRRAAPDHEHVRPAGDDLRSHGCRPRRPQPADPGHARWLPDRLRLRAAGRDPPLEPEPVPAELHLRGGDRRAARPAERALHPRGCRGGARMSQVRRLPELLAPAVLVLATALLGLEVSNYLQAYFLDTLVKVAIVIALYVFIGNSGVLSFGTISFVALGAWTAGVLSVPRSEKPAIIPNLAHSLAVHTTGNLTSLFFAALVGGVCAFIVGVPLMRLSGLAA